MTFQEAYPREKMKKVEDHLRKVWSGEVKCTFSSISLTPNYRQLEDESQTAELAAKAILANANYPGYNPPRYIVDYGTVSTAAYWNGEVHLPVGGCLSISPIIFDVEQADQITPMAADGGDGKRGIDSFNEVCEKLGSNDLYCTTIDFQGPLTTAALLWEQTDFMCAMYTEPEAVHRFLDGVTTQLIAIMKAYIKNSKNRVCGNVWPYIWLPSDIGICITEDYMPLISAEMYKEFGIPYVERISKEFGGLFIHCCGKYEHQLENLKNSSIQLLGLEFHHPYMDAETLFEAFGDSVLFVPFLDSQGEDFAGLAEYIDHIRSIKTEKTRLWFILNPEDSEYQKQVEAVKRITEEYEDM